MTRRWWMRLISAALVPVSVKAQNVISADPKYDIGVAVKYYPPQWRLEVPDAAGKPKNNQCPVCGTMADPFHNPKICMGPPINGIRNSIGCLSDERLIRCKRCNTAFWQDAE